MGQGGSAAQPATVIRTGRRVNVVRCISFLDMGRLNVFVFLASFVLGILSLIFGSRALIEYYDLFPPDPYSEDPLTWRNVLHSAWGVRRKSLLEQQLANDPEFLKKYTVTMDDMKIPIAIAVVFGFSAVAMFFALKKER